METQEQLLEQMDEFFLKNGIVHFKAKELTWINYLKKRSIPREDLWTNILPTLHFLEFVRVKFGPIRIISGYRDPASNAAIPGTAKNSQHMQFRAADSAPISYNVKAYQNYIKDFWLGKILITQKEMDLFGAITKEMGIFKYPWGVHVDFLFKYRIGKNWR